MRYKINKQMFYYYINKPKKRVFGFLYADCMQLTYKQFFFFSKKSKLQMFFFEQTSWLI